MIFPTNQNIRREMPIDLIAMHEEIKSGGGYAEISAGRADLRARQNEIARTLRGIYLPEV
jgi:hypothetical protein